MARARPHACSIAAVIILVLAGVVPALLPTSSVQALSASPAQTSAPFPWDFGEWCPSYHSYNGCNTTQSPSQYTVSFAPSQVSETGSSVQLSMNNTATSSGAINTWGEETWTSPATFNATITLPCNNAGQIVNWPAFWTVGTTGTWPAHGEIDILEGLGGKATWSYHYANASGQDALVSAAPAGNWCGTHTYGADWTSSSLTFIWDGITVGSVTSAQIGVPIASDPMYAIFDYGASPVYGGPTVGGVTMNLLNFSAS